MTYTVVITDADDAVLDTRVAESTAEALAQFLQERNPDRWGHTVGSLMRHHDRAKVRASRLEGSMFLDPARDLTVSRHVGYQPGDPAYTASVQP